MALEILREKILEQGPASPHLTCAVSMTVQEASFVLLGLQHLQKIRGQGFAREQLIVDPMFEWAVAKPILSQNPSLTIDDVVAMASCMLREVKSMHARFDTLITIRAQKFTKQEPTFEPQDAVPCAPGIASLARTPVARARVCGWENDVWFASKAGAEFIDFWNNTHPVTLPCIVLPKDEMVVAVVFFGLQTIVSMLQDMQEDIQNAKFNSSDVALTDAQRKQSNAQVLVNIRNPFQDVVAAAEFLADPLQNFAEGLEIGLLDAWFAAEDLRLASSAIIDTSVLQSHLSQAFTRNRHFLDTVQKLKSAAHAWIRTPAEVANIDEKLVASCTQTLKAFETMNRSVGSLQMPVKPSLDLQGLWTRVQLFVLRLQKPFRGSCVQSLSSAGSALSGGASETSLHVQTLELTARNWTDVENVLRTFPQSTGAGLALMINDSVLLPLTQMHTLENKWIGGRVESGEHWLDAAFREFDEETFMRSDPWVDTFETCENTGKHRWVVLDGKTQGPWMQLAELEAIQEPCLAQLAAEQNGFRIVRNVRCNVSYPRKRLHTRKLLQQAFDSTSDSVRQQVLKSLRVITERTGAKSYNTIVLQLTPLLDRPRMKSLLDLPGNFSLHSKQIEVCVKSFGDVFVGEIVSTNWSNAFAMEHPGFAWTKVNECPPRIQRALNK